MSSISVLLFLVSEKTEGWKKERNGILQLYVCVDLVFAKEGKATN